MGYKKIFNLITLQLIIPLSTMTKAEYKETYGIDLDSIDFEKVTLLQEDGAKNKYYVDEIKETENGVDIYAGGKILSIGSSVSVVDGAYSVANSKAIYVHPITISISPNSTLTCLVFNNSSEPFTKETFADWISQLYSQIGGIVRIMASGNFVISSVNNIASFIGYNESGYIIYGRVNNTGAETVVSYATKELFIEGIATFYDGVNKIN